MKIKQKSALFFIVLIAVTFPIFAVNAKELPKENNVLTPSEAPKFDANIEYTFQGFIVRGTFTEFSSDISYVQPLYSLDGETYQTCGINWDLYWLDGDENALAKLYHQICLYSNQEPLKSYLAEKLDSFYLKLRLTRENGTTYETQAALIDRGTPQPVPKEATPAAKFDSSMFVIESRPFRCYGKYQLTIRENAVPEDVSAFLPNTLPIEIQLENEKGLHLFTKGVVDCPVTWKPISLPQLSAGETITLTDAAEEIVVPKGTLLTTPTGIFILNEPLHLDMGEVRLVLNVIAENENPTGVLSAENTGLEMAFHLKPTGATAIRAYTFSNGQKEWIEIPNLPLLNAINAQPSTANSGYTLVLDTTCEPYQSYLAAANAGETPEPFFVGLKIEGGVYDGQQLVLSWPDTYDLPMNLPDIGGSGGNEGNAGTDNKGDSTEDGQRPELPQNPNTPPVSPKNPNIQLPPWQHILNPFYTSVSPHLITLTMTGTDTTVETHSTATGTDMTVESHSAATETDMTVESHSTATETDTIGKTHPAAVHGDTATKSAKTHSSEKILQETSKNTPLSPVVPDDGTQTYQQEAELPERSTNKNKYRPFLLVIVFVIVLVIISAAYSKHRDT